MNYAQINELLKMRTMEVAQLLLPNGTQSGQFWSDGYVKVSSSGLWYDFESKDSGNLLALWMRCKGVSGDTAARDAVTYLGINGVKKTEQWNLLWSHKQGCFHVETQSATEQAGQSAFAQRRPMDYIVLFQCDSSEAATRFKDQLVAKYGRPE